MARIEDAPTGQQIVSTLAQLASDHSDIDWSVNCGNMSSSLLLWAIDTGLIEAPATGNIEVEIKNTNTGVLTVARMSRDALGRFVNAEIPGVAGAFPALICFFNLRWATRRAHCCQQAKSLTLSQGIRSRAWMSRCLW